MKFQADTGKREENIEDTARRELLEETGAEQYTIRPICAYSVTGKNRVNESGGMTFGMLYFADVTRFGALPESRLKRWFRLRICR